MNNINNRKKWQGFALLDQFRCPCNSYSTALFFFSLQNYNELKIMSSSPHNYYAYVWQLLAKLHVHVATMQVFCYMSQNALWFDIHVATCTQLLSTIQCCSLAVQNSSKPDFTLASAVQDLGHNDANLGHCSYMHMYIPFLIFSCHFSLAIFGGAMAPCPSPQFLRLCHSCLTCTCRFTYHYYFLSSVYILHLKVSTYMYMCIQCVFTVHDCCGMQTIQVLPHICMSGQNSCMYKYMYMYMYIH